MKNQFLLLTILVAALSISCIQAHRFLQISLSDYKNQNFNQVLQDAKTLSGDSQIETEYNDLLIKTQDQIVDYFSTDITEETDYWKKYYLLSKLVLFSDKQWERPTNQAIITDNYLTKLINQKNLFLESISSCRKDKDIVNILNTEYNYDMIEKIESNSFYQYILTQLPKGIIHHIHWSASVDYKGVFESIKSLYDSGVYDETLVVVSVELETQFNNKFTGKKYTKFLITKQKYLNQDTNLQTKFEGFFKENNKCLQNTKSTADLQEFKDKYLQSYYYYKLCDGKVYLPSNQQDLDSLKNIMKTTIAAFQRDQQAADGYPKEYSDQLTSESQNNNVFAIWYRFEQIFTAFDSILSEATIKYNYTDYLFKILQKEKTYGIEFRNKDKAEEIQMFTTMSTKYSIPFSYIIPGRKTTQQQNKVKSLTTITKQITGIDFFGYEDDPFNGARNFFSSTLNKATEGTFKELFTFLKNNNLYLHAGETTFFPSGKITTEYASQHYINDNIIHAALLPGVRRIGHGYAAAKNNLLISIFKKKKIIFEVTPISNQVLKTHKVKDSPFLTLLRSGIPVTISPDDPGLFGYTGVTQDWYQIIMQTNIQIDEIYLLLKNSIDHSSITDIKNNKSNYIDKLQKDLSQFIQNTPSVCPKEFIILSGGIINFILISILYYFIF